MQSSALPVHVVPRCWQLPFDFDLIRGGDQVFHEFFDYRTHNQVRHYKGVMRMADGKNAIDMAYTDLKEL
eukprot:1206759-Rhodomonas_salina.1